MNLLEDILINILSTEEIHVVFPNLEINMAEAVERECYKALQDIKAVVEDDSLEDRECFIRIEEILHILEDTGSHGGNRHDFG